MKYCNYKNELFGIYWDKGDSVILHPETENGQTNGSLVEVKSEEIEMVQD